MLEEKARQTYDVYVEKVELKKRLEGENKIIEEENKALIKQLDQEQGQVGREKERQAIITAEKDSLESELLEKQNKLAHTDYVKMLFYRTVLSTIYQRSLFITENRQNSVPPTDLWFRPCRALSRYF